MALSKEYAGHGHLKHIAVYDDGTIGVKFDHPVNIIPLNLADLSEDAQIGYVRFAGEVAEKQGIGSLQDNETEFAKIITDAVKAREK